MLDLIFCFLFSNFYDICLIFVWYLFDICVNRYKQEFWKFHEGKINKLPSVEVWGSGNPKREFLHVDDLADACLFLMNKYNSSEIINVGTGQDLSINELALLIKKVTGYKGEISYNTNKPDGTPRKLLDVSKLQALGWEHKINLLKGVNSVYEEYSKLYKAQ